MLGEVVWQGNAVHVAICDAAGAAHRPLGTSADPDRRASRPLGLGPHCDARVGRAVGAGHEAVAPRLPADLDRVERAAAALGKRDVQALELLPAPSQAEAEDEPAPGDEIDGGGVLREANRVEERGEQQPGADLDPLGARGDGGREREQRRHVAVVDEVVLARPDRVESEPFCLDRQLDRLLVQVGVGAVVPWDALAGDEAVAELHAAERTVSVKMAPRRAT